MAFGSNNTLITRALQRLVPQVSIRLPGFITGNTYDLTFIDEARTPARSKFRLPFAPMIEVTRSNQIIRRSTLRPSRFQVIEGWRTESPSIRISGLIRKEAILLNLEQKPLELLTCIDSLTTNGRDGTGYVENKMLGAMNINKIVVESVHIPNTPSHIDYMYEITAYGVAPYDQLQIEESSGIRDLPSSEQVNTQFGTLG